MATDSKSYWHSLTRQGICINTCMKIKELILEKKAKIDQDAEVLESATAGATSAGNVSVGPVYTNKKGKTYKNKDGTVKNAQDIKGANLITGGSLARR
jgi:hypothetical protein